MNARGLYEAYSERPEELLVSDDERLIILRGLDLLARVEESPNLLIQRLYQLPDSYVGMKAAAALVALKAERDRAEERAQAWRRWTNYAEEVLREALASFRLTQNIDDYPEDHWSQKARNIAMRRDFPRTP